MESNALLYFFSTMAQCLAALAALPAIFIHFRTQVLLRLMVGLGKSMLIRWETEPDYIQRFVPTLGSRKLLDHLKLQAAVEREDLRAIHGLLHAFSAVEKELFKQPKSNGFGGALNHFEKLNRSRTKLRVDLLWTVFFALLGIGFSLSGIMALSFKASCWVPLLIAITVIAGTVTFILVGLLVYKGMADPKEWDLRKRKTVQ